MSEATPPSRLPVPEPGSSPDWDLFSSDSTQEVTSGGGSDDEDWQDWQDWQTVDFPDALSIDAIPAQIHAANVDLTAQPSLAADADAEVPQVAELIHLIQELNQCNTLLLDRVAQLEAALEQAQMEQPPDTATSDAPLAETQAQVAQLMSQLELTHQTSQRQQILVETLTGQIESSQERIAQLERECALVQQRCSDQAQQLMESENTCRDLRSRLQRQQRYTLQFKAALDKCLDVPTPSYEPSADPSFSADASGSVTNRGSVTNPGSMADAQPRDRLDNPQIAEPLNAIAAQPLLPRVSRIQPWTSRPRFEISVSEAAHEYHVTSLMEQRLNRIRQTEAAAPHIDEADSLVTASQPPAASPSEPEIASEPVAAIAADPVDMGEKLDQQITAAAQQLATSLDAIDSTLLDAPAANAEPDSATAEAEDTLWQDLARLIEVSTDEVVLASQAEDFTAFQTQRSIEPASDDLPETAAAQTPVPQAVSAAPARKPQLPAAEAAASPMVRSNWPSPVVYPLRSTRRLQSLAAVDLPKFPRSDEG
jgi:hypothetical protein